MLAFGIRDGRSLDFVTDQKRSLQNGLGSVGCWRLEFGAGAARLRRTSLTLPVAGATGARVAAALLAAAATPLRSLRSPSSRLRRSRIWELEMKHSEIKMNTPEICTNTPPTLIAHHVLSVVFELPPLVTDVFTNTQHCVVRMCKELLLEVMVI